jgi:DNA-binding XRE family transcriptional regulator
MPTATSGQRRRDANGHLLSGAITVTAAMIEERRTRAREWKKFRRDYLYSQENLATALGIGRRTITAIEAGECNPTPRILRAFRDLVKRERQAEVA